MLLMLKNVTCYIVVHTFVSIIPLKLFKDISRDSET